MDRETGTPAGFPLTLAGSGVLLREFRPQDWPQVHAYASLEETVRYMPWGPNNEEASKDFVAQSMAAAHSVPRTNFTLAVTVPDNRVIGGISILLNPDDHGEAALGYCMHPRHWGKGHATEAARLMLNFGFSRLRLHRIIATCDEENTASIRVLEKLRMRREAHHQEDRRQKGVWRNTLVFALLEREWRSSADGLKSSDWDASTGV